MAGADQAFYRGDDRIIGGVCSGLAAGLRVDAVWIRVVFVVLAFVQGIGVLIYIVLWLVMPDRSREAAPRSAMDSMADDVRRVGRDIQGQLRSLFGPSPAAGAARPSSEPVTPPPPPPPSPPPVQGSANHQQIGLGVVLVVVGIVFLAANTGVVAWTLVWPAGLIAVGVVLFLRTLERRA